MLFIVPSHIECHIRLNSIQINITEGTKSDFTVHMAYDFNCTNIQTVENEIHLHVSLYCPGELMNIKLLMIPLYIGLYIYIYNSCMFMFTFISTYIYM